MKKLVSSLLILLIIGLSVPVNAQNKDSIKNAEKLNKIKLAEKKKQDSIKEAERLNKIKLAEKRRKDSIEEIRKNEEEISRTAGAQMVYVGGGTFTMGNNANPDTRPVHKVTVSSFYIGKYEVTKQYWEEVMGINTSDTTQCDECPVERVSWDDVHEFLQKLNQKTGKNFRLPTEAEWEYAAKGGKKSGGFTYSGNNSINAIAWYSKNSGSKAHPVGTKKPNELGLYDMTGNVWELCSDWYSPTYYQSSPKKDPQGASLGIYHVYRGGGWFTDPPFCEVTYRLSSRPVYRLGRLGFRIVISQ